MLKEIKQISFFNKLFNVHGYEWPKIGMAWLVRFFYRIGFVIGWTVLVGLIVTTYGIAFLPYLFVMNAIFVIIGSFVYSTILFKYKRQNLMVGTIFITGLLLLTAIPFADSHRSLFFALVIVSVAMFLTQFKIILSGYIEEMFTPLQSERTFPLIESSDTIGGILGGLMVTLLAKDIEPQAFIYLWVGFLFLIIPCMYMYEVFNKEVALFQRNEVKHKKRGKDIGVLAEIKNDFLSVENVSFIKGLFLIVFFQWLLFNLLEFQYTKAVFQNISGLVLDAGSGMEHAFIHDLGALFILFSSSALLVQFFIGSRLINYLGVAGSMMLHPIVTLLSMLGLTFSFSFLPAVMTKNNFTITTIIHTNAYHSAYYAVDEKLRDHTRELLEGVVRPVGAIVGTLALILLQGFFEGELLIYYVNLLMLLVAVLMFYVAYTQQARYTQVALDDLVGQRPRRIRVNAIDILAQRGHKDALPVLLKVLADKKEPVVIRVKVLRSLGELRDPKAIEGILEVFSSSKVAIRSAAIETLLCYKKLGSVGKRRLFFEYKMVEALKKFYKFEKREEVRAKIISLLSRLSTIGTLEFLLGILAHSRGKLRENAIYALGKFNDKAVIEFLLPYLDANSPWQKINTAVALGQFDEYKDEMLYIIADFLHSGDVAKISAGLYAIGEVGLKDKRGLCVSYLQSEHMDIRISSAIALAKMGYNDATPVLLDLLFDKDGVGSRKIKKMLKNVDVRISKNIDKILKQVVSVEISKLMEKHKNKSLSRLGRKTLHTLKWLYSLIDEYDEIEVIDNILKN